MSVYIVEIARELAKMGHTVDAYTRIHDPADPIEIQLAENARLIHLEAGERMQLDKFLVYTYLPDFCCAVEAYRKEHDLEYDLVFSHYWLSAMTGEYFSRWWNVPHVTMFHTLGKVKNTFGIGPTEPDLRIQTETELARNVYRIIAPTEREKKELVCRYGASPESIGVVPCGVNPELFKPVDKEAARKQFGLGSGKIILFVGRIDPMKCIPNLMKAVPYLKNREDVSLVMVGGGEDDRLDTGTPRQIARDLGIEDKMVFTGAVDQSRMPYYYSAADVCVIPSYYESFGMVSLESLSCGTPVVANDVGDMKNIIRRGETGYVVESNDPRLLAENIDMVLENGSRSPEFIRETVSEYSWDKITEGLDRELRKAVCNYPVCVS